MHRERLAASLVRLADGATHGMDADLRLHVAGSMDHLLIEIESAFSTHAEFPHHGSHGKELLQIGILG